MAISYSRALDSAWRRMGDLLFRPFNLARWFVIGFTAWLASFLDSGSSGGGAQRLIEGDNDTGLDGWQDHIVDTVEQIMAEAWLVVLVAVLVVVGILVGIALTWLGSRGQFMLLDNLVHRRAEVGRPWREYAAQGDSLFLWQIVYSILVFLLVAVPAALGIFWAVGLIALDKAWLTLPFFIAAGVVAFIVIVTLIYIEFFLLHIIVPIMYRYRCGTVAAWGRFRQAFGRQPGHLVLFGLLQLGDALVAAAILVVVSLATCCVGLLLILLPYIGSVLTLPVTAFQRYLDLEFVAMLDADWSLPGPTVSGEVQGDGAVVRPEDIGPDTGGPQPGPE